MISLLVAQFGSGDPALKWCLRMHPPLLSLGGPVSFFDRVSFADVLALVSRAVKTRSFLMINVCLGIDPYQPMSAVRCRSSCSSGGGFGFRGTCHRGRRCGR